MAPDAWLCVDRNSQMAEWISQLPSGCVTWWRCSQSLEPKENASQGDEVLLLFRHLILAGCYVWPWCNLFSRKQFTPWEQELSTPRNKRREADRPKETRRECLICFPARTGLCLTGWEQWHLWRAFSFRVSWGQKAGGMTKTRCGKANIKRLTVHHGHH